MFGGVDASGGFYNVLWQFEVATNSWKWMRGDTMPFQPGLYGTKGIPSPANDPGSRAYGVVSWVDVGNNLWLYGGYGIDLNGSYGNLSDLWKYSTTSNQWTWVNGDSSIDMPATYIDFQLFSAANHPGMRSETTASWT
jgi:hypothetical protein